MLSQNLRIVTLLPSATEIVAALGLADAIVGRSHECDYPATIKNRPVCTEAQINSDKPSAEIDDDINNLVKRALSIYQVKTDVLEQLQPTHIVTQDQCDVCAVNFDVVEKAVANLTNSQPQIISLQPNLLTEVWADIERVATILGVESHSLLNQYSLASKPVGKRHRKCQKMTALLLLASSGLIRSWLLVTGFLN